MDDTAQLGLPLLQPSQAQKHVTVNEAFARLDALTELVLASRTLATPPTLAAESTVYAVPAGGVNAWSGQDGKLAVWSNGGWLFVAPRRGWRAFVADASRVALFDGAAWIDGALAVSPFGAATVLGVTEIDHVIGAGATSTTVPAVAANTMVIGVSARVIAPITGSLTSWKLGSAGAPDRFGTGLGLGLGSYALGMLSAPTTYYAAAPLLLTATGGSFAGGKVRIAVHGLTLTVPAA